MIEVNQKIELESGVESSEVNSELVITKEDKGKGKLVEEDPSENMS